MGLSLVRFWRAFEISGVKHPKPPSLGTPTINVTFTNPVMVAPALLELLHDSTITLKNQWQVIT